MNRKRIIKLNDSEIVLLLVFFAMMAQTTASATKTESSSGSQNSDPSSPPLKKPSVDITTISPRTQKLIAVIARNKEASSWKKAKYVEGAGVDSRKFIIQLSRMNKGEEGDEDSHGRTPLKYKLLASLSHEDFQKNIFYSSKAITLPANDSRVSQEHEISYTCEEEYKASRKPWMKVSLSLVQAESGEEVSSFSYYKFCTEVKLRKFDLSLCFIIAVAILSVAVFAKWGTDGAKEFNQLRSSHGAPDSLEDFASDSLRASHLFYFTLACSVSLLALFYFLKYLELVLNSCFTGVSFISLWGTATAIFLEMKSEKGKYIIQEIEKHSEHLLIIGASLAISVAYFLTKHWALNNVIALSLVFFSIRMVKLPNLYLASVLLTFSFTYDVFWVLLSKQLFGASVMDAVATDLQLPLKLEMPIFQDYPLQIKSMLGLGDLLLPGLFISLCHRIDLQFKTGGHYYLAGVIGFSLGLILSLVSLVLWDHAQPALLYIVPALLASFLATAVARREFTLLWRMESDL